MDGPSSSSRPYTASGRPHTARPSTASEHGPYFDYQPQYTPYSQEYSIEEEEEEDDESEAEDVFAFGPPSTADAAPRPSSPSTAPLASPTVSFPPATFDPHAPYPSYNAAGPSSLHTRHPYPTSPQVESPPSTESNPTDDPYRLRNLVHPETSPTATTRTSRTGTVQTGRSGVSSAVSSREVHVSLPRAKDRIEEEQLDDPQKSRPPSSVTSFPSLDSGVASMKCVSTYSAPSEVLSVL